jgi:hypothetical protein
MRRFLGVYSVLLWLLSIWLIAAGSLGIGLANLPHDQLTADSIAKDDNKALWAARIGLVRGDLWKQLAYTEAGLAFNKSTDAGRVDQAKRNLERAVKLAPAEGGAWLLLADLATVYRWNAPTAGALLLMSYYTAPHDQSLIPVRLMVASHLDVTSDPELSHLFKQEIEDILIFEANIKPALTRAYTSGTPQARQVIADSAKDLDASFAKSLGTP